MKPAPIEVARTAWAGSLPDWVEALALECGRTSQNMAGEGQGFHCRKPAAHPDVPGLCGLPQKQE